MPNTDNDALMITADDLEQWTEDALTQGSQPSRYVYALLWARLVDRYEPATAEDPS